MKKFLFIIPLLVCLGFLGCNEEAPTTPSAESVSIDPGQDKASLDIWDMEVKKVFQGTHTDFEVRIFLANATEDMYFSQIAIAYIADYVDIVDWEWGPAVACTTHNSASFAALDSEFIWPYMPCSNGTTNPGVLYWRFQGGAANDSDDRINCSTRWGNQHGFYLTMYFEGYDPGHDVFWWKCGIDSPEGDPCITNALNCGYGDMDVDTWIEGSPVYEDGIYYDECAYVEDDPGFCFY